MRRNMMMTSQDQTRGKLISAARCTPISLFMVLVPLMTWQCELHLCATQVSKLNNMARAVMCNTTVELKPDLKVEEWRRGVE